MQYKKMFKKMSTQVNVMLVIMCMVECVAAVGTMYIQLRYLNPYIVDTIVACIPMLVTLAVVTILCCIITGVVFNGYSEKLANANKRRLGQQKSQNGAAAKKAIAAKATKLPAEVVKEDDEEDDDDYQKILNAALSKTERQDKAKQAAKVAHQHTPVQNQKESVPSLDDEDDDFLSDEEAANRSQVFSSEDETIEPLNEESSDEGFYQSGDSSFYSDEDREDGTFYQEAESYESGYEDLTEESALQESGNAEVQQEDGNYKISSSAEYSRSEMDYIARLNSALRNAGIDSATYSIGAFERGKVSIFRTPDEIWHVTGKNTYMPEQGTCFPRIAKAGVFFTRSLCS